MLTVSQSLLELFRRDLWKDSRYLEVVEQDGRKLIRRFTDGNVTVSKENDFIKRLRGRVSFNIPEIVGESDECLTFEYIEGTRAFNLLMDLRALYRAESKTNYRDFALQLLNLLREDLEAFQRSLSDDPVGSGNREIYPVREKLANLYQVLTGVLPDTVGFGEIESGLEQIAEVFERASSIPFRDATPKNVILSLPQLFQQRFNSRNGRLNAVRGLCSTGEMSHLLSHDNIFHIDFSGCHHLCPEIDDWIALMEHESSSWLLSGTRAASPDREVSDLCTRFVRFSRFAGRKLAYRLLNRSGHRVRFSYDHEAGYFLTLSNICRYLQSAGVIDSGKLYTLMNDLFQATSLAPEKDYFQELQPVRGRRTYYSDVFPC